MALFVVLRNASVTVALSTTISSAAFAQRIPGGDAGRYRTQADAFRSEVRSKLVEMIARLGDRWDDEDATKPARFYGTNATIVLGPELVIDGRDEIRKEFETRLGKMHGVQLTMESFDLSGDLAFIRGTMQYDLTHGSAPSTKEIAVFTMTLRPWRDKWLIETHTIGARPVLESP